MRPLVASSDYTLLLSIRISQAPKYDFVDGNKSKLYNALTSSIVGNKLGSVAKFDKLQGKSVQLIQLGY